jgi:hypothetical protein
MEKNEELIEKINAFESEVRALRKKPQGFGQELSAKRRKLERLMSGHETNLVLNKVKDAEILAKEIKKVETEIKTLEFEQNTFGDQAEVAIGDPDSRLFNDAASIVAEAHAQIVPLERELKKFINGDLDHEKERYLKAISDFSEKLRLLWDLTRAGLVAQKFLPKELQVCKPPVLVSPDQGDFEINAEKVSEVYKRLSKTAFLNI